MTDFGPMEPDLAWLQGESDTPPQYDVSQFAPGANGVQGQPQQAPPQQPPPYQGQDPLGGTIGPESFGERMLARMDEMDQQYTPSIHAPYEAPMPGAPGTPTQGHPTPQPTPGQPPQPQQPFPGVEPQQPHPGMPPQAPQPIVRPEPGAPTTTPEGGQQAGGVGAPSPAPTPPAEIDIDKTLEYMFKRKLSNEEKQGLVNAIVDMTTMTPDQWDLVNAALSGQQQAPPQQQPTPTQPVPGQPLPGQQAPPYNPTPQPQPIQTGDPLIDEHLAPYLSQAVQQAVSPMQARMEAMQQLIEEDRQARLAQQRMAVDQGLEEGTQAWREFHPDLTEQDVTNIMAVVRRDGMFPRYLNRGMAPRDAMMQAMEQVYMMDPEHQRQVVARQMQEAQVRAQEDARREQLAAQMNPAGGSVVQQPVDNDAALVQEIQQMLAGGQPAFN